MSPAAVTVLASSVQVSGLHGVLIVLAAVLFLIATVVAWFVEPRLRWATALSAGLCLLALAFIIT